MNLKKKSHSKKFWSQNTKTNGQNFCPFYSTITTTFHKSGIIRFY
uniref:Uncharacterized protein n=1 Tax=Siphoviridae sp. ctOsn3 TaxID=2823577 RepID=A0A8S5LGD4_9CAUD|nr:MAG TPA: hypothetical protein [Siphoviridae sp. ctOsn3]